MKEGATLQALVNLAQEVQLDPDVGELPGGDVLRDLTNGVAGFALIVCLIGLVVGAAMWAIGQTSSNYQQTVTGKRAFLISAMSALLIGGAAAIINFFYSAGRTI